MKPNKVKTRPAKGTPLQELPAPGTTVFCLISLGSSTRLMVRAARVVRHKSATEVVVLREYQVCLKLENLYGTHEEARTAAQNKNLERILKVSPQP